MEGLWGDIDPVKNMKTVDLLIIEEYVCVNHVLRSICLRVRVEEYIQTRRASDIVRGDFFIQRSFLIQQSNEAF
jgi:hypothetical protein